MCDPIHTGFMIEWDLYWFSGKIKNFKNIFFSRPPLRMKKKKKNQLHIAAVIGSPLVRNLFYFFKVFRGGLLLGLSL